MASFCLQVILVSLAAFCCCSEGASSCNLTFSGIAWPPAPLAVDLQDVNVSFFNISPNGTVSYKGRPFFFRVTNVFGGSPSPRSDNILLKLRSRERAIFFSLFEGIPYAEDVAIMALGHLHFPSAAGQFFINEIVIYFQKFRPPPPQIPSFPYLYTYSIIFDYGGYK